MRGLVFGAVVLVALVCAGEASGSRLGFLPLDERFTTRDAFINLATVTPFDVQTPSTDLLPSRKQPPPLPDLLDWVKSTLPSCDAAVLSSEMVLYGGLIQSRVSNQSTADVEANLNVLVSLKKANPGLKLYLSSVVMRIPSYNEDVEEPWYWALYGRDLYLYSYYTDAADQTGNATYRQLAQDAEAKVPPAIVDKFLWRRQRNFNVTVDMLHMLSADPDLFEYFYITLDDNALYGFNIAESRKLKALVKQLGLGGKVLIYPGADEVGLTLLSRYSVDYAGKPPVILQTVYRNISTIDLVPGFEGQAMVLTLKDQTLAAGAVAQNETGANATLLVNDFSLFPQISASQQTTTGRSVSDYKMFTAAACAASAAHPVGFTDIRYSNGADVVFIEYIKSLASSCGLTLDHAAYAGWNTDGNTLGTIIANTVLLTLFGSGGTAAADANVRFNTLRLIEDDGYQANVRQQLIGFVQQTSVPDVNDLEVGLDFYERYSFKLLQEVTDELQDTFKTNLQLASVYYPWNRTFEIGLAVEPAATIIPSLE